jgi:tRNA threonylcarbamoyladenosine biosynthesis protein TsaE
VIPPEWSVCVVARSAAQTQAVGAAIAAVVAPGDVVLLSGELGAGKTVLTKGLVAALGGGEATTSPTFTLCHVYPTTPPIAHVDCYRVGPTDDLADLALDELLEDGAVVVVEWGERVRGLFGAEALECVLSAPALGADGNGPAEDERLVVLRGAGAAWSARRGDLYAALAATGLAPADAGEDGAAP